MIVTEERKQKMRAWHAEHRAEVSARKKARREANPCLHREQRLRSAARHPECILLRAAKERAERYGITFSIVAADIIIPSVCPILGIALKRGSGKMHAASPSLDRIVPELGYIAGNVAVISMKANRLKSDGTSAQHRLIANWMDRTIGGGT